jgi:hypothetical protein
MNERIRELLEQAGIAVIDDPVVGTVVHFKVDNDDLTKQGKALEQFVRLVVSDCADTIQKEVSMKYAQGGQEETEDFMCGHYAGSLLSRVVIKQRFGVTENE